MSSSPDQDMPEVFGIHKNAQAALMQSDGEAILQTSMKLVLQVVKEGSDFDIRDSAAQFRR